MTLQKDNSKILKLAIVLINIHLLYSCKSELKIKVCENKQMLTKSNIVFDTYTNNLKDLKICISNHKIPIFLYDSCFNCNCFVPILSSNEKINCFESILDSLTFKELSYLANTEDSALLKRMCLKEREIFNVNQNHLSVWETIQKVYKKKLDLLEISEYYSKYSIPNQSLIDTNSYYVFSYQTGINEKKMHVMYRFFSNGQFKKYQVMDYSTNPDISNNCIQVGIYFVEISSENVKLESLYVSKNSSNFIKEEIKFKISNSGLILISTIRSDATYSNYLKGKVFRKYKKINMITPK